MLTDDIVARVIASIPEPIGDDTAVWVSDLCFAIEAEVRKQDEALIRQMLEALGVATTPFAKDRQEVLRTITAGRARLEDKP